MLQFIIHRSHLRREDDEIIVGDDILVLPIGHGYGFHRHMTLVRALADGLGEHGAGGATGAEHQHSLFLARSLYLGCRHRLGLGRDCLWLVLDNLAASHGGLSLDKLGIIDTEERIVEDCIHHQEQRSQRKGQRREAGADHEADRSRGCPGQDKAERVHAEHIDEEFECPDIQDRRENERHEEHRVQHDRSAEEDRLIDCEANRDHGSAAHGLELLGFRDEGAHGAEHQGSTGAADGGNEVGSRMGEDGRSMAAAGDDLQVHFDIGDIDSGDCRLDNGRAMDADEPEQGHRAVDDSNADIAIRSHEERLEDFEYPGAEHHAGDVLEADGEEPKSQDRDRQRNEVREGLGNVMRHFLRQLDGDIAGNKEFVDIRHNEGNDESGKQAFRTHELCGISALDRLHGQEKQADDGDDHHGGVIDLAELRQGVVDAAGEALGDGGDHQHGQDAHRAVIGLPQHAADALRPVVIEYLRHAGHEDEERGEQDDGDAADEAVPDGPQVFVVGDLFKERLHSLYELDDGFHRLSLPFTGSVKIALRLAFDVYACIISLNHSCVFPSFENAFMPSLSSCGTGNAPFLPFCHMQHATS